MISTLDLTTVTAKGGTFSRFLNLSIDLIFIVLLMIPLATIAIVMAYRVFVLWMYIILLPAFILFKAFGRGDKFSFLDGKFKVETILSTIFSPVIICFALSMAVLLINTMNEVVNSGAWDFEGVHLDYIDISEWVHVGGEGLGEIIVSLVGLALAWILLFWAIKATSIGEKIGETVDKTARNFANSVPFIGLPGVDGRVSLDSLRKIDDLAKEKWGGENIFKEHNELMDERLGNLFSLPSDRNYTKQYEILNKKEN
ncbi:hypothetical protein IJM86_03810 [bacterium]|nr:hypothetical protein [bacterium]